MSWRTVCIGLGCIAVFTAGYRYAASVYEGKILEIEKEASLKSQMVGEEYRRKEREINARLIQVIDERDKARRELVDLRGSLERVRSEYLSYKQRVAAAPCSSGVDARAAAGKCEELLLRGAELSARCGRLLQSNAVEHDALVKAQQ